MQEMIRELGTGFDEVLAVIQDKQQVFAAQIIGDSLKQRDAVELAQMERGCDGGEDVGRIRQLGQLDEPNPIFEFR
ncbi:MAG TPA: hypothetical protein VIV15_14540 [Anaerolineales bacterium]